MIDFSGLFKVLCDEIAEDKRYLQKTWHIRLCTKISSVNILLMAIWNWIADSFGACYVVYQCQLVNAYS